MDPQNNGKMFDNRTILAIVVVGSIFFGWQYYLKAKYPQYYTAKKPAVEATAPSQALENPTKAETGLAQAKTQTAPNVGNTTTLPEKNFPIETEEFKAELTSRGMGFRNVLLKKHTDRQKNALELAQAKTATFATWTINGTEPISFDVVEEKPLHFLGKATVEGVSITKSVFYDSQLGHWKMKVVLENVGTGFGGIKTIVSEKRNLTSGGSFFSPAVDHQEVVVDTENNIKRINSSSDLESPDQILKNVSFASVGMQYFTLALVDESTLTPEVKMSIPQTANEDLIIEVRHKIAEPTAHVEFELRAYAGSKNLEKLEAVDTRLSKIVNFGFFNTIGRVLRTVLNWFFGFVGNWGLAIVLLTICVRILVLPFNLISYRSMKAMQAIQPSMQALREKYKDDPATQQRETMALMKNHKVNPFGGCLPMLLQMPIFFALFQVLGHSVELYQAPFYFWIHDLSLRDPFFILPVCIGVLMFFQQKLTPMTTMDPAQAKVLKWMPLLFVFFMISLPAGLSIYTFVNTLFGVVQQYFFLNGTRKPVSMQTARVSS